MIAEQDLVRRPRAPQNSAKTTHDAEHAKESKDYFVSWVPEILKQDTAFESRVTENQSNGTPTTSNDHVLPNCPKNFTKQSHK